LSLALDQGLPIVPSTRGLWKNLAGPVPVYHPQRSPGHASNGDVARLTSLVLGRSKAESAGLVFTKESGTAADPRNALGAISAAAKDLGVSGVGLHTLRHSFATHMRAAGVSLHTASELLGHSPVAVTGDAHGHVANQGARFAVQQFSATMGW
jgi:integrase